MRVGVDDLMRSKLIELQKKRDSYDAKYETTRFEEMILFGTESAFEARQKELEELNRKKLLHDECKHLKNLLNEICLPVMREEKERQLLEFRERERRKQLE